MNRYFAMALLLASFAATADASPITTTFESFSLTSESYLNDAGPSGFFSATATNLTTTTTHLMTPGTDGRSRTRPTRPLQGISISIARLREGAPAARIRMP